MTLHKGDQVQSSALARDWQALPPTLAAVSLARRFISKSLSGVDRDVVDVAVLLTSELVANAVLHGLAPIELQLHRQHGTLRIEVRDAGQPFIARDAAAWNLTDEGGRGLPLLYALATAWGSDTMRNAVTGKTLWFELAHNQPEPPSHNPVRPGG